MALKIGITGGIGSGKTTVSKIIARQGYTIFNADEIAKNILTEDSEVRTKIITAFGKESYVDNLPNKQYLAKSVFSNPEKLTKINSIIHPPTIYKINQLCDKELLVNDLVFVEAALIYEANMQNNYNYILVIAAKEDLRINRVAARDNSNKVEVSNRIGNQIEEESKISLADFVIHNNGSFEELESKTNLFLTIFKSLSK